MLASTHQAWGLLDADFSSRLTHPTLLPALNRMLALDEDEVHALDDEQVVNLFSALPGEGTRADHAWLAQPQRQNVEWGDSVVDRADIVCVVRESLDTYVEGVTPELHVRVVRALSGGHFVVAWQVSLQRMHALQNRWLQSRAAAAVSAPAPPPDPAAAPAGPARAGPSSAASVSVSNAAVARAREHTGRAGKAPS